MVSSRYEGDPNAGDDDGANDSLTPESVPEGPVASASAPVPDRGADSRFDGFEIPENLPFGVVLFDSDQNVIYCNPKHADLLNFDIRESGGIESWLRHGCRDSDYADRIVSSWREHIWRKQLPRVFSLKSTDEKLREIEFRTKLLDDGGLLLTLIDVTESRRSEDALRLTETKFNTVFDHMTLGVAVVDRTGRFFEVNPAFEKLIGFGGGKLRRMSLQDLVVPEDFVRLQQAEHELRAENGEGDRSLAIQFFRNSSEETVNTQVTLSPIRDGSRKLQFTACFIREVSGEETMRQNLRESQEQNRALLEAIPDLILLMDRSGEVRDLFPPASQWDEDLEFGEEWVGGEIGSRWPAFGESAAALIPRALEYGAVESLEFSDRGGTFRYAARLARCGNEEVVAVIADETDEMSSRESQARQGAVFKHLRDGIILTDLHGGIVDCNPAAERCFGYPASELSGCGLARLYALPENREDFNLWLADALNRTGQWKANTTFYRKDGSSGLAEVLFVPVKDEDHPPFSILGLHHEIADEPIDGDSVERIQHRFRNQLQTVSGLFGLEFMEKTPPASGSAPMLQKFQARLRAITRIHELVENRNGSETVCLLSFARLLADDLIRIHGIANVAESPIAIYGDERVPASLEGATSFGLLIAELGLAALCNRGRMAAAEAGNRSGIGFLIQRCDDGRSQLIASGPTELFLGVSGAILDCLAGQLRGRLHGVTRDGKSEIRVRFPSTDC